MSNLSRVREQNPHNFQTERDLGPKRWSPISPIGNKLRDHPPSEADADRIRKSGCIEIERYAMGCQWGSV